MGKKAEGILADLRTLRSAYSNLQSFYNQAADMNITAGNLSSAYVGYARASDWEEAVQLLDEVIGDRE